MSSETMTYMVRPLFRGLLLGLAIAGGLSFTLYSLVGDWVTASIWLVGAALSLYLWYRTIKQPYLQISKQGIVIHTSVLRAPIQISWTSIRSIEYEPSRRYVVLNTDKGRLIISVVFLKPEQRNEVLQALRDVVVK
jgi:hypothetical protein